jgi:hypothetical protein
MDEHGASVAEWWSFGLVKIGEFSRKEVPNDDVGRVRKFEGGRDGPESELHY